MTARLLRLLLAAVLAVPAIGVVSHGARVMIDCSAATAATPHHVAVVVEHQNHALVRVCVGFSGSTIGAEDALRASGLRPAFSNSGGYGDEVCQIDGEPPSFPPDGCLQPNTPYWSLWVSRAGGGGGGWAFSPVGVSSLTLADGDAEGWHFDNAGGAAPPSPQGTCPMPAPGGGPPSSHPSPPAMHAATPAAVATPQVVPSSVAAAPPASRTEPPSPSPTAPPVALAPSAASTPPPSANVPMRSGPAVAQPANSGPSVAGWTLYGLLVTAGLAVLAAEMWRRRSSP